MLVRLLKKFSMTGVTFIKWFPFLISAILYIFDSFFNRKSIFLIPAILAILFFIVSYRDHSKILSSELFHKAKPQMIHSLRTILSLESALTSLFGITGYFLFNLTIDFFEIILNGALLQASEGNYRSLSYIVRNLREILFSQEALIFVIWLISLALLSVIILFVKEFILSTTLKDKNQNLVKSMKGDIRKYNFIVGFAAMGFHTYFSMLFFFMSSVLFHSMGNKIITIDEQLETAISPDSYGRYSFLVFSIFMFNGAFISPFFIKTSILQNIFAITLSIPILYSLLIRSKMSISINEKIVTLKILGILCAIVIIFLTIFSEKANPFVFRFVQMIPNIELTGDDLVKLSVYIIGFVKVLYTSVGLAIIYDLVKEKEIKEEAMTLPFSYF